MLTLFKAVGAAAMLLLVVLDMNNWSPFSNRSSSGQNLSSSSSGTTRGPGSTGSIGHK